MAFTRRPLLNVLWLNARGSIKAWISLFLSHHWRNSSGFGTTLFSFWYMSDCWCIVSWKYHILLWLVQLQRKLLFEPMMMMTSYSKSCFQRRPKKLQKCLRSSIWQKTVSKTQSWNLRNFLPHILYVKSILTVKKPLVKVMFQDSKMANLISHKIWVAGKFINFQTVYKYYNICSWSSKLLYCE